MSYQLEYNLESLKIINNPKNRKYIKFYFILTALVIGTITAHFLGVAFENFMITPSHSAQAAANELAENLRDGVSVQDAFQTFCIAVIE